VKTRLRLRNAWTLLELLVAIGMVGVLLGLLLPAIQKAHSAAARSRCQNNLKQLALALQAYHDVSGRLPPGMSLRADGGALPFLSWNARLLPFIEQNELWKDIQTAYALNPDFLSVPPHTHRKTVVRAFTCPASDRSGRSVKVQGGQEVAFTVYLGNEGTDLNAIDGLLFVDSAVRFGDIVDGLSNTLMIGERPPSADYRFGWWYAGWGQNQTGSAEMVLGVRERLATDEPCSAGPYHFGPGSDQNVCDFLHFWSGHSGGANFAFADGAVHFLSYAADEVLPALATRAGGEPAAWSE
jgi:prepilin-type processing-associated H-X9-DG protein